ncbi:MAG: hypothetical protein ACI95X_001167, partial [Paraglaciecola sp.]
KPMPPIVPSITGRLKNGKGEMIRNKYSYTVAVEVAAKHSTKPQAIK